MRPDGGGRFPIEEALRGLSLFPVPDGWTPLEAIALVKCMDEDGRPTWAFRMTEGLSEEELLGALTVRTDLLRRDLLRSYDGDEDDD